MSKKKKTKKGRKSGGGSENSLSCEQKPQTTAKPATKHLVSMRFDPVTVTRVKMLAKEWGVTQTRVVEKLVDEAWIRGGRKAD